MKENGKLIFIGIFIALFCLIYFGAKTKPKAHEQIEKSRALNLENTNIKNLLKDAYASLEKEDNDLIKALEIQMTSAENDSMKIKSYEMLSGNWFKLGYKAIAGHYAESIAKIKEDENSWAIAGTTYASGIKTSKTDKEKDFCYTRGVNAFENAISLNPENLDHKINLAICSVDNPPKDNPMKGIRMLLDLNKNYPDNIGTIYQLASLGLQTGQNEKAIQRLNKILELDPDNNRAFCLLSKAYENLGDASNALKFKEKCLN